VEFNKVPGSTRNQSAAGSGIEKVYDNGDGIDEETPFGKLVSYLFTLDEKEYGDAMDQMGGAEYAQHLQSVLWSTRSMQRTITERMECSDGGSRDAQSSLGGKGTGTGVVPTGGKPMDSTGCFEPGRASLWVRGFGQINSMSGDNNNPGMDENQNGVTFGGDYSFDENWFLGLAGGYFNSTGEFDAWGGRNGASIDYDGWQLAAYGGFDNSDYYLRGIVAYGGYDGTSHRSFALNQNWDDTDHDAYHGTHTPITGNLSGDLSSNVLSFYGETGYRVDISNSATFTPYVGLNVASASLDGFTESDPSNTGAALRINDSDAMSIASVLGLRFNGEMIMGSGLFTPSVSVAWAHEFADTAQVDMSYAGEGASPGADFVISGTDVALDAILIDAGANFSVSGTFDIGLYYNGSYNADYMSNAVSARLHYKF
jgi:outer membrane autotransporter protein